jgi:hypothetical protein
LEAVQKAAELKPNLIVLDIGLPKLNGIEFSSLSTMALEPSGSAFFRFEGKYDLLLTERDREACSPAQ